jgi:hypothetical protein
LTRRIALCWTPPECWIRVFRDARSPVLCRVFPPRIVHCKACGQGIFGLCTGFGFGLVRSGELEPTPAAMDPDTGVTVQSPLGFEPRICNRTKVSPSSISPVSRKPYFR